MSRQMVEDAAREIIQIYNVDFTPEETLEILKTAARLAEEQLNERSQDS